MPHDEPTLDTGDLVLLPGDDVDGARPYALEWRGEPAGSVSVVRSGSTTATLSVTVLPAHRGNGLGTRAVRRVIDHVFADLGLTRVEARVAADDRAGLRVALRSGLRREGLLRGDRAVDGVPVDTVVLGRLRDDPTPDSREGFTAVLDSQLPSKRAIAQGVLRDESGQVLLCELTYKPEWDLPGGVVDPGESPAACIVREVQEELGLPVTVQRLLAVDWLPPWLGWSDAVLLVFDLGTVPRDTLDRARLAPREIVAVHWDELDAVPSRVAPYTARLLSALATPLDGGPTVYLEDGHRAFPG